MTIKEKVKISENSSKYTLFKEGIFYKVYNINAMLFVANIKPFKVKVKYIKNRPCELAARSNNIK